ncbi:MAG: DUF1592 domain-containing protein, partial [Planctomycetaceae bacterium]|nr:DUF1592 domain-containing protein [Planctomycetaceae bacterium]
CDDFQQAMVEVIATILSSPKFLYLVQEDSERAGEQLNQHELATRLSMFLWCSIPDAELMELANQNRLHDVAVLQEQVDRMLQDQRSGRFCNQFVHQWLGMQLLEYLKVDRKAYPGFNAALKEAMQKEPIAFFQEVLQQNHSVVDLLHSDYMMVNERLARHYGLNQVFGNEFRRVPLEPHHRRGGLLTQAGFLAMNSDGKDSHPLKRGVWLLEKVLNDPPPPPPPAVPKIDLADPEIAKLTLKERIANHRDQAACRSCHMKIDPWGIAFENFDAVGSWRTEIAGHAVDASVELPGHQTLDGIEGLKAYLLLHRQDQFARALTEKLATFATGRPLTFADYAELDRMTAELRRRGDGLATLITILVSSDLFRNR